MYGSGGTLSAVLQRVNFFSKEGKLPRKGLVAIIQLKAFQFRSLSMLIAEISEDNRILAEKDFQQAHSPWSC